MASSVWDKVKLEPVRGGEKNGAAVYRYQYRFLDVPAGSADETVEMKVKMDDRKTTTTFTFVNDNHAPIYIAEICNPRSVIQLLKNSRHTTHAIPDKIRTIIAYEAMKESYENTRLALFMICDALGSNGKSTGVLGNDNPYFCGDAVYRSGGFSITKFTEGDKLSAEKLFEDVLSKHLSPKNTAHELMAQIDQIYTGLKKPKFRRDERAEALEFRLEVGSLLLSNFERKASRQLQSEAPSPSELKELAENAVAFLREYQETAKTYYRLCWPEQMNDKKLPSIYAEHVKDFSDSVLAPIESQLKIAEESKRLGGNLADITLHALSGQSESRQRRL